MPISALTYFCGYIPALPFSVFAAIMLMLLADVPSHKKTSFIITTASLMFAAYTVIYNVTLWSNHV